MDAMGVRGFGKAIAMRRKELGLSQHDLAKRVGVSQQTISYHENSQQHIEKMTQSVVRVYAKALEMEHRELQALAIEQAEDTDE